VKIIICVVSRTIRRFDIFRIRRRQHIQNWQCIDVCILKHTVII